MTISLRDAATARAAVVRAQGDRPSQRRCAEEEGSGARVSVRLQDMHLREPADGATITFGGFASVTNRGYEMWDMFGPYTEKVALGAFGQTLEREDLDVPLVLQHNDLRRIARTTNGTLRLSEVLAGDPTGLLVDADLDPTDEDVRYIVPKLRAGLIDEMSFKFRITEGRWSPDWTEYTISGVELHRGDVAIVGYGANPLTAGAGIRTADLADLVRAMDDESASQALAVLRARLEPQISRAVITDDDVRVRLS